MFMVDQDGYFVVFTNGACINNGRESSMVIPVDMVFFLVLSSLTKFLQQVPV
jgi:hypothetical protein